MTQNEGRKKIVDFIEKRIDKPDVKGYKPLSVFFDCEKFEKRLKKTVDRLDRILYKSVFYLGVVRLSKSGRKNTVQRQKSS